MSVDITDLRAFYASPLGAIAQRMVRAQVDRFWPNLAGLRLLGLGYATPYLPEPGSPCERVLAFMPAAQGVVNWPAEGLSASTLVDATALPLPDTVVDRVLVVHALETVQGPADMLHEVSRILSPGGRAILVVPNRRGLWARMDRTPFGQGQPFSRSQLRALMRGALLSPNGWAETLYVPPVRSKLLLSSAGAWERLGLDLSLPFAGLHVVEATKQLHRPVLVRKTQRARRLAPVLAPVPASRRSATD